MLALMLAACTREVNVSDLEMKKLAFAELPDTVQLILTDSEPFTKISGSKFLLYADPRLNYKLEAKETGPYTDDFRIIDNQKKVTLIIPYSKAFPFIIYHNALFIPDRYNVKGNESARLAQYEKYLLEFN